MATITTVLAASNTGNLKCLPNNCVLLFIICHFYCCGGWIVLLNFFFSYFFSHIDCSLWSFICIHIYITPYTDSYVMSGCLTCRWSRNYTFWQTVSTWTDSQLNIAMDALLYICKYMFIDLGILNTWVYVCEISQMLKAFVDCADWMIILLKKSQCYWW